MRFSEVGRRERGRPSVGGRLRAHRRRAVAHRRRRAAPRGLLFSLTLARKKIYSIFFPVAH